MECGSLALEIPVDIFSDCSLMSKGQRAVLRGACHGHDGNISDKVQVTAERTAENFTFHFHAKSMGPVFQTKLREAWRCRIRSVREERVDSVGEEMCGVTGMLATEPSENLEPPAILAAALHLAREIKTKTHHLRLHTKYYQAQGTKRKTEVRSQPLPSVSVNLPEPEEEEPELLEMSAETPLSESEHESDIDNDLEEALAMQDQVTVEIPKNITEDSVTVEIPNNISNDDDDNDEPPNVETFSEPEESSTKSSPSKGITQKDEPQEHEESVTESEESPVKKRRSRRVKPTVLASPSEDTQPPSLEDVECNLCGRTWFSTYQSMKVHRTYCSSHNIRQTHQFCCVMCLARFKTKRALQLHRRDIHGLNDMGRNAPPPPPLPNSKTCEHCGVTFDPTVNIDIHRRFHCPRNPDKAKPHYCSVCPEVLTSLAELRQHKDAAHGISSVRRKEPSPRVCSVCGLLFQTRSGLYAHVLQNHRGEEAFRFKCDHCDKKYTSAQKLERHQVKHIGTRDFTCDKCGKTYKSRSHLQTHVVHVHKNRYPYYCEVCGHGVAKKAYLATHVCGRVRRVQDKDRVVQVLTSQQAEQPDKPQKPKKRRRAKDKTADTPHTSNSNTVNSIHSQEVQVQEEILTPYDQTGLAPSMVAPPGYNNVHTELVHMTAEEHALRMETLMRQSVQHHEDAVQGLRLRLQIHRESMQVYNQEPVHTQVQPAYKPAEYTQEYKPCEQHPTEYKPDFKPQNTATDGTVPDYKSSLQEFMETVVDSESMLVSSVTVESAAPEGSSQVMTGLDTPGPENPTQVVQVPADQRQLALY